jgi:predicted transcriptional regulator
VDAVVQVLHDQGPKREGELARMLGSGRTQEDVASELRHNKEQGLIELDAEGYWGITAAGAALFPER